MALGTVVPVIGGLLVAFLLYAFLFIGRREKGLPPGPPTAPIIGNIHQIPTKGSYLTFTEWSKTYGGIFSLKLGPGTAIVLTSRHLVKQLIDKKSNIYSDRPHSYVSHNLITGGDHVLIAHYGKTWQRYRKVIHQHFMESIVMKDHLPLQQAEASQLLKDFLERPDQHMEHPKRYTNSIACATIWGVRSPTVDTPHMNRLYELMENWSVVMEPGNTPPVDIFPFLHYVPERLFGNWRSRAKDVGKAMNDLYSDMLSGLEKRREAVGSKYSFMDRVLDQKEKLELNRHQLYFLGGTMMEGASDTSSSIIIAAIQAFTKWPEVMRKAQQEIDSVMGEDRSPVWADYAQLPYVAATVKEAMRWRPVVPLAFPHAVDEDDWIDGYKIPKGSVIFINAWGMHHDEKRFPDSNTFDPDHYKGVTALASELAQATNPDDRDHYGYGSGRRLCPGIHLAERNLFLAISKLLWAFEFAPGKDKDGNPIIPDTDPTTGYSEGFLVCAKPYALEVKPRSEARRETILREYQEAKRDVFSAFDN
ncbi:uncharacterized protein Z520_07931 [Fonsecaea multimorphosa CBS 102226]|uniref:Cytochrome P450 n=1 Tax=Fonsecaea multimorphosa CBS 102226 TaxID=1442371 RepID=A0A0D2KHJ7_9EURO|nr:uncharacterized protein Z520_07931 [Fonsecaea multimorphosa CBS 102226]KIX96153.1 hypothetical protein Z520_07931 [Fonsecaea multimorphosa CBS 102226]OAL22265.1 hypothetical protein AYO22_07309 [Fonsecaea multimorphosa]